MLKTNNTPFTDVAQLIAVTETKDASNYTVKTETAREVFCSFSEGVNRSEYYESMKAGMKLSATIEVWEADYESEKLISHDSKTYEVRRVWPTGADTLYLYLEEAVR